MAKKARENVPNPVAEFEAIAAAAADSILRDLPKLTSRLCSPLISTMLHDGMCYRDLGAEYFARRNPPKGAAKLAKSNPQPAVMSKVRVEPLNGADHGAKR